LETFTAAVSARSAASIDPALSYAAALSIQNAVDPKADQI
jgi:hypothetical protein